MSVNVVVAGFGPGVCTSGATVTPAGATSNFVAHFLVAVSWVQRTTPLSNSTSRAVFEDHFMVRMRPSGPAPSTIGPSGAPAGTPRFCLGAGSAPPGRGSLTTGPLGQGRTFQVLGNPTPMSSVSHTRLVPSATRPVVPDAMVAAPE